MALSARVVSTCVIVYVVAGVSVNANLVSTYVVVSFGVNRLSTAVFSICCYLIRFQS